MPDLNNRLYQLMSDSELRDEAWRRRTAAGIPPVPQYGTGLLSYMEREATISYLRRNDDWNDAFETFLKRNK